MTQTVQPASTPDAPPACSPSCDMSGQTLGDFRLLRRLGQGGMGQVYLAEQTSLKRNVAIKIMRPDIAISAVSFQRFKAEAEAIARVNHANIVQVYAFGEQAGLHYMALEYVEGRNLREYLSKRGTVDLPLAVSIMRQVGGALQRAGELGIVHRDIKPENILLTRRGEVKVADFGLSRCFGSEQTAPNLTQTGITLGTPLYMSPEQVQGLPVDPRTDIYSFGVTCYQMLAGHPPFRGETAFELALQHVKNEPAPLSSARPDLPRQLCAIVHKMMAKDVNGRYPSCAEMLQDLAQIRDDSSGSPGSLSSTLLLRTAAAGRSTKMRVVVSCLTVVLALCAGGALAWRNNRPRQPSTVDVQPLATEQVLSEREKHEKFLKDAVAEYADPANDRERLDQGIRFRRDLGLFYLQNDRLDDANEFFAGLAAGAIKPYQELGRAGQAIVLARQDRADQSNKIFLDLARAKVIGVDPGSRSRVLFEKAQLPYEIARALSRNKTNATAEHPFPAELEGLRTPPKRQAPTGPLRRTGLDKGVSKKS